MKINKKKQYINTFLTTCQFGTTVYAKKKNNYQQLNDGSVLKGTPRLFTWRDENP